MILKTNYNDAFQAAEKVFLFKFVFCSFKVAQRSKNKCREKIMSKVCEKIHAKCIHSSNSKSSDAVES